jgi:hypothetical protein
MKPKAAAVPAAIRVRASRARHSSVADTVRDIDVTQAVDATSDSGLKVSPEPSLYSACVSGRRYLLFREA